MALNIRDTEKHRHVFLAEFDNLDILNLDYCRISILVADLDYCDGLFVSSYTKTGLLRNYLILNNSLFANDSRQKKYLLKITGVHEFCHFIAIIYAITASSIEIARENIKKRLNGTLDELTRTNVLKIYDILSERIPDNTSEDDIPEEMTDSHFRLDFEGETPDYNILFRNFLFSQELFETEFDANKQREYKKLVKTGKKDNLSKAVNDILVPSLIKIANEKCIPLLFAKKQLLKWLHLYS